jgi:hypothetical protein
MTVGVKTKNGSITRLGEVADESGGEGSLKINLTEVDAINANLTAGPRTDLVSGLAANDNICSPGVQLYGAGFILSDEEVKTWKKLPDWKNLQKIVFRYMNGRDFMVIPVNSIAPSGGAVV